MVRTNRKIKIKTILKLLVIAFVAFILLFLFFRKGNFLNKITLTHFKYQEREENNYSTPYLLSEKEILILLKDNFLKKNNLNYFINATEKPEKDLVTYDVVISKTDKDIKNEISEGVIVKNLKANSVLQQYFPRIFFRIWNNSIYTDINLDGIKELVIDRWDGGNGSLSETSLICQLTDSGFKEISPEDIRTDEHLGIHKIEDLNKDGIYELIVIDNTWENTLCTDHVSSPVRYIIYSWKNGEYKVASLEFLGFYDVNGNSLFLYDYYEKTLSNLLLKECSGAKDFCFGPALTSYFAYQQMGKEKEGWNQFLSLTSGTIDSIWPSKTCRDYVIKLHNESKQIEPPSKDVVNKKVNQ